MKLTWSAVTKSKKALREKAENKPIAEKLKTLERLRERRLAIRNAVRKSGT